MKNFLIPNKKNHYKPYLLRKIALLTYTVILIAVNTLGGIFGIDEALASTITPTNIIQLTNEERVSVGLNSLDNNPQLAAAALAKANNMFEEQYWDHFGPNGETPWQFIREAGYYYVYAGENLAKGFQTAEGVHEAWMASPTHKANIMSENYQDIGVAVVEGVLDGKQTTLVVQMFGNLTTEIAGVTESTTKTETEESEVKIGDEEGEIKSIRITSPETSAVITDPSMQVKGEVTNVTGEYTVEVFDNTELIGETDSNSDDWTFAKESDWSEGDHTLQAGIKDTDVTSEEVNFSMDSTAPEVDLATVSVQSVSEGTYTVKFAVESAWESASLVTGNQNISVQYSDFKDEEYVTIELNKEDIGTSAVLMVSDFVGNTSSLDISEYFEETAESTGLISSISLLSTNLGDKISIGIVAFIFLLLCVELFFYIKKGELAHIKEDLFTIGIWWIILSIAVFNGYTGLII